MKLCKDCEKTREEEQWVLMPMDEFMELFHAAVNLRHIKSTLGLEDNDGI